MEGSWWARSGWSRSGGFVRSREVRLDGLHSLGVSQEVPMLLAFGCWLLVQWESVVVIAGRVS
jgi:hypothetical protein